MILGIILAIIVGIVLLSILKKGISKIAGFVGNLIVWIFAILGGLIYIIFAGPAVLCSKIFYGITKVLHIQKFVYHLLAFTNPASFIYLCKIHIPYSRKEKFIKCKEFFNKKKTERNNTIAICSFVTLEGLFFILMPAIKNVSEDAFYFFGIFGIAYILAAFIYTFVKISKWKKENTALYESCIEWRKWTQKEVKSVMENNIEEKLISMAAELSKTDSNKNNFTETSMPYGRVAAFISYFQKNLDEEEPVFFSVQMSPSEDELREYGILITTKGIYISEQGKTDVEIPLNGIWNISSNGKDYIFDYGLYFKKPKTVCINKEASSVDLCILIENLNSMNDIFLAVTQEKVITEFDKTFNIDYETNVLEKFNSNQNIKDMSKAAEIGGIGVSLEQNAHIYNDEIKYYMNGARGGGYAAEYANNAVDRLTGNKVFNMAQELEDGHQKLNGADRNVNGLNIQTKYYKSASESIGAAFEHKQALYLNDDGSMMQIEVPRDQYNQAVQEMQKRIKTGQVPGETNPENAKNYVRRGHFTYFQANNIALAGSIEGIAVDISQGIVCSVPGAGITVLLSFANAVWQGEDIKNAAKQSVLTGLKVMGKNAAIYTAIMQLSRDKIINIFAPKIKVGEAGKKVVKSFDYVNNPIFTGAEKLAGKINSSNLAKSKAGKKLKLDKVNGRQIIGGTVTAVVVYGPDICKAFQGKISGKQLIKNSTVATAGLVGATLGNFIPIPIVGSMIGGSLGSFVAKKVLDNFIEDDAVAMFRIMREEFLDVVMLYSFNVDEFNIIVNATIANSEISKILQSMYQSGVPKEYADTLINAEVQKVLSERKKITSAEFNQGVQLALAI